MCSGIPTTPHCVPIVSTISALSYIECYLSNIGLGTFDPTLGGASKNMVVSYRTKRTDQMGYKENTTKSSLEHISAHT